MRGICHDGTSWDLGPVPSSLNKQWIEMSESIHEEQTRSCERLAITLRMARG